MPQPLSRVKPNAEINLGKLGDLPIVRHQPIALMAMAVISTWATVELHMLETYVNLAGGAEDTAAAMFLSLETQSAKSSAINTLAAKKLDTKLKPLLRAIQGITKSQQTARDKIAHWVWGDSAEIPDAVLLIDPRQLVKSSIHVGKLMESSRRGEKVTIPELDRSKVFVFRIMDFLKDAEANTRLASYWATFESLMHGFTDAEGERYASLCSQPEIADRLRHLDEPD